jgi:neutral peptidase B
MAARRSMKVLGSLAKLLQRDPAFRFRQDDALGVVRELRGNLANVGAAGAKGLRGAGVRFLKAHPDLFGEVPQGPMKVLEETPDPQGGQSVTLQQYHGPYPVYGGSVRFHMNQDGILDNVSNRLFPDLAKVPRKPRVGAEEAVKAAQRSTKCNSAPARAPELMVSRHQGEPHLVWEIRLNDTRPGERGAPALWVVYVDAATGKVLSYYDNVQTAGPVVGSGTGYYSGGGAVNAWFNDTTYQLRDTTRTGMGGPEIITNDEDGTSPSADADDNWNDLSASPRDQNQGPEVDAHRYAANVVDYYRTVHGRNSFDGSGANLVTLVHLGTNYSNGYWDGTKVNLGDGTGAAATGDDYECSDDWLAHEFTHAYTQYTCGLQYLNESGALNEAFSDIFAAFITGDWLVFEDTWLKASAPAWRNMVDPTNGGLWNVADPITSVLAGHQPSHYTVRYTGSADNGGVHINSGIINNLFYLLTVGGTHTVSGITVAGVGQTASEQMLFRCMTVNLVGNPTATFLDFRVAMLDACLDLFPTDLVKLSQVKNAFNAVGVGPDIYVRDNLADAGAEPYPGSYLYASPDIINRTAPAANPAVDFADLGNDSLWQNVEFGQANYVYVRLQNRGSANGNAAINVYFSGASTFGTPASWIHIGALAETAIAPGSVRISGPLTFPSALIPGVGHYCMIAVVSDALDPAPDHNLITSVSDYLNFVRNTNNIAYRNMDVVDMVPGTPGTLEAQVRGLPGLRERFDLRVDLGRFVPGAVIRLRGPAGVLGGGVPRGLKLVARQKDQDIYEVLAGREKSRNLAFLGIRELVGDPAPGFDNLLVEKEFRLAVDYVLPGKDAFLELVGRMPRDGFVLAVRQMWKGEVVGAVGLRLVAPRHVAKHPARRNQSPKRRRRRA